MQLYFLLSPYFNFDIQLCFFGGVQKQKTSYKQMLFFRAERPRNTEYPFRGDNRYRESIQLWINYFIISDDVADAEVTGEREESTDTAGISHREEDFHRRRSYGT